jgi:drug/metabolite transporter (DMT)-like permease
MVLAAVVVNERPSLAQLAGAIAILAGVVIATAAHRGPQPVPVQ